MKYVTLQNFQIILKLKINIMHLWEYATIIEIQKGNPSNFIRNNEREYDRLKSLTVKCPLRSLQ